MTNKKSEKDWTEPAHLGESDWRSLKHIKQLFDQASKDEAMGFALYSCDTVIREEIPPHIWKAMGGMLTPAGEEKLRAYERSLKSKRKK